MTSATEHMEALYDAWYRAYRRELAAEAAFEEALGRCWDGETGTLDEDADYEHRRARLVRAQAVTEAALSALPADHSEARAEQLIAQAEERWQLKRRGEPDSVPSREEV